MQKRYKLKDNAGNFIYVHASSRNEARQKALKKSKGNVVYIID
jgi:valyl-tRNA synthetase